MAAENPLYRTTHIYNLLCKKPLQTISWSTDCQNSSISTWPSNCGGGSSISLTVRHFAQNQCYLVGLVLLKEDRPLFTWHAKNSLLVQVHYHDRWMDPTVHTWKIVIMCYQCLEVEITVKKGVMIWILFLVCLFQDVQGPANCSVIL